MLPAEIALKQFDVRKRKSINVQPGIVEELSHLTIADIAAASQTYSSRRVEISTSIHCQVCGRKAKTAHAKFNQHIGLLFVRFHRSIEGDMCFRCLNDYFWMYTTVMLLLGWWGMFSFIKTLFALPENIFSYLSALGEFIRPGGPKVYVDV